PELPPLIVKPATVTVLLDPTAALANVPLADPAPRLTVSPEMTPDNAALPVLSVAVVVWSSDLFLPVPPLTVTASAVMSALALRDALPIFPELPPLIVKPATVTVLLDPTAALANVPLADPVPRLTVSPEMTPDNAALPVLSAAV